MQSRFSAVVEVAQKQSPRCQNLTSVFQNADKADDLKDVVKKDSEHTALGESSKGDRATDFKLSPINWIQSLEDGAWMF